MNEARYWFGNVVVLKDGQVLIAGGTRYGGYDDIVSTELYDPKVEEWKLSGNLNQARRGATLVSLKNGNVLIAGGRQGRPDTPGFLGSAEIYDPTIGKWSYTGDMNIPREHAVSVRLLDGRVLVFGGEGPWFVFGRTAEIYDPDQGKWTRTGDLNTVHYWPSTLLLPDGRVLVVGGSDGKQNVNSSVEIYNPATGIWALQTPIHTERGSAIINLIDDHTVLLAGGTNQGTTGIVSLRSVEILNLENGIWFAGPDLPVGRNAHESIWIPNIGILVTGGWNESPQTGALTSSELFVPFSFQNQPIQNCSP